MSSHDHPSHHGHPAHQHDPNHDPNDHPANSAADTPVFTSTDPSTNPHATITSKLAGDVKGALHGVTGSIQAATGTVIGNKTMQEKGFEKMSEEDARLAAKTGKAPVGTGTRDRVENVDEGHSAPRDS